MAASPGPFAAAGTALGVDDGEGRAVSLGPNLGERRAMHEEVEGFRDVGGVVADALEVLGDEQQVRAGGDVAPLLAHVCEELAEQAGRHPLEVLLPAPDPARPLC